MRSVLIVICLWAFAASLQAHDWPHWRGPQFNGVALTPDAPERWSHSEGVVWRAGIEGSGNSSPVIVANRVYVTTAITAFRRTGPRLASDCLIGLVVLFGLPALIRHRWNQHIQRISNEHANTWYRAVQTLDLVLFGLLAIALLLFGTLIAIGPPAIDAGLDRVREVGVELARSLGRQRTNLSFLAWDEGIPQNTWITSTSMALGSLALIPFLFPRHSGIRAGAGAALLVGVAAAKAFVPWASAYGDRHPTGILIVLYSPVIALAVWHLFVSLVGLIPTAWQLSAVSTTSSRVLTLIPVVLSLALVASPNYLSQQEVLTRRVVCLNALTGERVWHTDVFTTLPEAKSPLNSHATPSPIVVGDRIMAAFGVGIAGIDLDGRVQWSKMFPLWIENSIYGAGSSPVADSDAVFVTSDREFESPVSSRVTAYERSTGDELWSYAPWFAHDGYTTPAIVDDGARQLLVTHTSKTLVGYDIGRGTVAWTLRTPVAQPVPSVIADGGRLYVTGGKGGDGYTAAYQLRHEAAPAELWTSRRSPADISSPVLYKGRLYTITSSGIMVNYNAESGQIIWRERLRSGNGSFYASLVAADDKIYAASTNGTTFVVAAEETFRLVSQSSLPEEIFASPAFAADSLYVRTANALYRIRNKD